LLEKQTVPVRAAWTETLAGRIVINDTIIHVRTAEATAFLRRLIAVKGAAPFISVYRTASSPENLS
jgi:hypothetical protein